MEYVLTWMLDCCHLLLFRIPEPMATGHHRTLCEPLLSASFAQSHPRCGCVRQHLLSLFHPQGQRESNLAVLPLKCWVLFGEGAKPWGLFLCRGPLTSHWCWVLSWGVVMRALSSIKGSVHNSDLQGPLLTPFISALQVSETQNTPLLDPKQKHWARSHLPSRRQRGRLPLLTWTWWVGCLVFLKSLWKRSHRQYTNPLLL